MDMSQPSWMCEISGTKDVNSFDCSPGSKAVEMTRLGGSAGIEGVDMEIGDILHG
jgi:hypothetical protein